MSGNIYQFGTVTLPHHMQNWNFSTPIRKNMVKTLNGVYDPGGPDVAELDLPYNVVVSALAYESTTSALGQALDTYRSLLGRRDRLWMRPHDTTAVDRWCWARLVDINYTATYNNRVTQPVDLIFQALSGWQGHAYGGAWNFDAGYLFDNGLYFDSNGATVLTGNDNISVPNAGNRTCTDLGITLTAGDDPISTVTLTVTSLVQFTWTGTLAALASLVIDCGARAVLNAGVGAYSGFALGANHYTAHWLPLLPGNTAVNVQVDLPGVLQYATLQFTYADAWL